MTWLGLILWLFTIWVAGFSLLVHLHHLSKLERCATGFVIGASLLPFALFLANALFSIPVFSANGGFWFTVVVTLSMLLWTSLYSYQQFVKSGRKQRRSSQQNVHRDDRLNPLSALMVFIMVAAIGLFIFQVISALQKPLFGWDEYSFWLYAAKLLYLSGGQSTSLLPDAYASYPLGFPYLVAWFYHLTGDVSIAHAKWLSPIITLCTLASVYAILRRLGQKQTSAWMAVALTVWGSQTYFWYNSLAFGEMIYVDTFSLALLYAVAFMHTRKSGDWLVFCALLGLSAFLRVDGDYIAIVTLTVFWIAFGTKNIRTALFQSQNVQKPKSMKKEASGTKLQSFWIGLLLLVVPTAVWTLFKAIHHVSGGWTTRISLAEIIKRLQPTFLQAMWSAVWHTVSNFTIYPIMYALALLVICLPFIKRRDIWFLTLTALAQIAYLFVAYITVFSRFEALHASSMDRYLLRVDPILSIALVLFLATRPSLAKKSKRHQRE